MIALGLSQGEEDGIVSAQPAIEALPTWAQILVTILVGLATLGIAFKGYLSKDRPSVVPESPATAAIMAASIADMGAIRNLSDVCIRLIGAVETLTRAVDEHTHHERNNVEISREMCARLRELVEELERQGKDQRAWDQRDEKRR
jgi:hypothetical protein